MLKLENINKSFNIGTVDETQIFDNFNLEIRDNEFVSIIGSNGSGKTTLLNMIGGSDYAQSGKILFDGVDISPQKEYRRAEYIARVFQDPKVGTCAGLSVLENMSLADNKTKKFGLSFAINKKRADYYKDLLRECDMGLEAKLNTQVNSLSGGQRQALALVIANMNKSKLMILDEHTAALDPKSSDIIMELTNKFARKNKASTLMVTHNLKHALNYGSRIIMMHEGHIVLDKSEKDKDTLVLQDVLNLFNEISIEAGNGL